MPKIITPIETKSFLKKIGHKIAIEIIGVKLGGCGNNLENKIINKKKIIFYVQFS